MNHISEQISYEIVPDDIAAFLKHYISNDKTYKNKKRKNIVFCSVSIFVIALIISGFNIAAALIWAIPGSFVFVIWFYLLERNQINKLGKAKRMNAAAKGVFCEHLLKVDDEGVFETTEVNTSLSKWQAVEKVEENDKHIFIFKNSVDAHVIPKRCFASSEEAQSFFASAQNFFQRNKE